MSSNKNSFDDDYDDNIDDLKVNELKFVLRIFHLPINGTKKELVNRLRGYFNSFNVAKKSYSSPSISPQSKTNQSVKQHGKI